MLALLGFVLTISLLVFIHEYGHYRAAKLFGVKVEEFSIGFGKELFSKIDKNGVRWKICIIPLGGFVKMYGDANAASVDHIKVADEKVAFYAKPLYARFLIVAAGPLANYLLAIIIISCFYFTYGKLELPAVIGDIMQSSPASVAGLQTDDKILEVNGTKINDFNDLQRKIIINPNRSLNFTVDRAGIITKIIVVPAEKETTADDAKSKIGYIGIKAKGKPTLKKLNVFSSIYSSTKEVIDISSLTLQAISQMIIGQRSSNEIYGPLTIAKESGKSLSHSPIEFALFIAMLSINLGLVNLLPIPILDGGHLLFMIYEGIARRPLSKQLQNILLKCGMIVIIFLIVISVSNDIKSLLF